MSKRTYALDFETYYDKKVSITELGPYHYLHHPMTDIYMVAVVELVPPEETEPPFMYCGEPDGMPWELLRGARVVAHNASFDEAVFKRLVELGKVPDGLGVEWCCTADLCAFLGTARSLKEAARELLGEEPDKTVREEMCGVTWEEAKRRDWGRRLREYCLNDAALCGRLWQQYSDRWPEEERRISAHTRRMASEGIHIDLAALQRARESVAEVLLTARDLIPWADSAPIGSPKAIATQCGLAGIPAPGSIAKDNPETIRWMQTYGAAHPWIQALYDYRSANTMLEKLNTLADRVRPDGEAEVNRLLYCGAGTGRFSGSGGFNMQNMYRGEKHGVDMRKIFVPHPGNVFIISDLAQIEARVVLYLAADEAQLDLLRDGTSIYEVHARATMGYTGTEPLKVADPDMYRLAKARVLGLGYGCGAAKFMLLAKAMAGVDLTLTEAKHQVSDFRAKNAKLVALWNNLESRLRMHNGRDCTFRLYSGRHLHYRRVHPFAGEWRATVQGKTTPYYGGKLCENITQATARDIFCHMLLALEDAGYTCRFHVHDEVVLEVPEGDAERAARHVNTIMSTAPDWLPGCPLAAETFISTHYCK